MYIESMDMDESILSPTEKIMLNKNSEIWDKAVIFDYINAELYSNGLESDGGRLESISPTYLRTTFAHVDPKSKKDWWLYCLFTLWGSACAKAVRRTLMKLSPGDLS